MCTGYPQNLPEVSRSGCTLRGATEADLEAMFQLDLICFEERFRFSRWAMRRYLCGPGAIAVVAEIGGRLAGFVIINTDRPGGRRTGYVTTLDVAPEVRRRGVTRMLMDRAEAEAAEADVMEIWLHVWTENLSAIRFYEGAGYERAGVAAGFYAPEAHAWVYRKGLADGRRVAP